MTNGSLLNYYVYIPRDLTDALSFLNDNRDAIVFSGGTYILKNQKEKFLKLPKKILFLKELAELNKISRTERFIEIGSCVSLEKIISTGKKILPKIIISAISKIANPILRNVATIGGNLCVKNMRMDLFPVFHLYDVQLELRNILESRWIYFNKFITDNNSLDIKNNELLTRIRIPFKTWNFEVYEKMSLQFQNSQNHLSFAGVSDIQKGIITDIRMSFGNLGDFFIRLKEFEADLVGRRLPFDEKEEELLTDILSESIKKYNLSSIQSYRIINKTKEFLRLYI